MSEPKRKFQSEMLLAAPLELQKISKPGESNKTDDQDFTTKKEICFPIELVDRVIEHIKKL